jgi:ABC-type transport system substrate-binding protein
MIFSRTLTPFLVGLILIACSGSSDEKETPESEEKSMYGGCFTIPVGSYFIPITMMEVQKLETAQVYDQVFERLVKYNPSTLAVEASLAKEWTVSEDGLTYTFTLQDSVYFHDNECFEGGKGRLMTAEDVKYSLTTIYTNDVTNRAYANFANTIVGGEDYRNGKATEISGITTNGNQVSITLEQPSVLFIQKLATVFASVVPEESMKFTDSYFPVGTGPFMYDKSSTTEKVVLKKNPDYYGLDEKGQPLPYLDSVVFVYYEHSEDQMDLFWEGGLSYVPNVPISKISEVLEDRIGDFESDPPKYELISEPQLSTTYLEFNMETPVFKNKKVRQAINYAINRQKLVEKIMKNQAYEIGKFGITPPLPKIFKDYDFEGIEDLSYTYNPEKAKTLLAEAGYPDGKGFPSIQFQFRLGNEYYLVASEIQNQLRSVLNINVDIEAIDFNELIENQALGKADMFRATWFGDYPNPGTFLINAYGKAVPSKRDEPSYTNSSRFRNAEFDKYFDQASAASTVEEAYVAYAAAEKILMEEAPFIILWYGEDMMLKQANVQQLETNGMRYLDLKQVYIMEPVAKGDDKKKES